MRKDYQKFVKSQFMRCVGEYEGGVREVAQLLGVAKKTIYRYLNGESDPPTSLFIAVCDLIGMDFSRNGEYIRRADSRELDALGGSPEPLLWEILMCGGFVNG